MRTSSALDREAQNLLQDAIARFGRDYRKNAGQPPDPHTQRGPADAWRNLAQNGWLALGLPEAVGGSGAAIGDLAPLLCASGEGLWREALIPCLGEACGALLAVKPGTLRDRLLQQIAAGELIAGFAMPYETEDATPAVARKAGDGFALTGHFRFLMGCDAWQTVLTPASFEQEPGIGLFAVEPNAHGVSRRMRDAIDGRRAADLVLDKTPATLIGGSDKIMTGAWARAQVLAAAEAAGVARAALDATLQYLAVRRQFGQALIQFQALQHRLVEMHIRTCEQAAMLEAACAAYDAGSPDLERVLWRLRAQSSQSTVWITQQAIQLHGGMGMTQELPIGLYYKRALLLDGLYGTYDRAVDALSAEPHFPLHRNAP